MTPPAYDVIIIGAGIVGAACADEAALAGLKVAVVEASIIGGGATAAGMGHLVVMDDSEPQFALTHYSRTLWQQLSKELPADVEYTSCGTIWVAANDLEMAEVERKATFYRERGVRVEVLSRAALAEAEPNLRTDLVGGLFVPEDSVIYPPRAAHFLLTRAQQQGAVLYSGNAVAVINTNGVQLTDDTQIVGKVVINAAGAWSLTLTPNLNIQKRKGHLVITDRYPRFVRHQLIELGYLASAHALTSDSVAFNIQPRATGQILIGSSRQYGVATTTVDEHILSQMLERARLYMPKLAQLTAIRIWTGFRAATPDKLPLIGLCPGYDNLYLATGHEGLGITTALGTAKLLIDQIVGRHSAIPVEPYLPTRIQQEPIHA
jgi:D-hydroxyproline dehydrogenase subunit beta